MKHLIQFLLVLALARLHYKKMLIANYRAYHNTMMIKEQLLDSRMSSGKGSYQHLTAKAKKKKKKFIGLA